MSGQVRAKQYDETLPRDPGTRLLAWYDRSRRHLPWRAAPGEAADPYRVWLSEIMLQQTVVKAAAPYFVNFTRRWPQVRQLAAAPLDDVLKEWAGLGYYARARNLHACAKMVCERFGGIFPDNESELLSLPGIGPYTAAAIAAIAFNRQCVPVDGNVERVMARYHALVTPLPEVKSQIKERTQALLPCERSGDLAQALMDLGATVCAPRNPACALCPLNADCAGLALGVAPDLPRKAEKKPRPVRRANAFWLERGDGSVLVRTRPPKGLLGGMTEIPSGSWVTQGFVAGVQDAPAHAAWRRLPGEVRHIFTHFELIVEVWRADIGAAADLTPAADPSRCRFVHKSMLAQEALPSVMKKIAAHALAVTGEAALLTRRA